MITDCCAIKTYAAENAEFKRIIIICIKYFLLVATGGHTIEDECQLHVKNNGKLLPGQIFTSKSGKLSCSAIVHIALPKWKDRKDGKEKEVDCLFEGVWLSLADAKKNGWSSIAISGSTGFPASAAAKAIVDATDEFLNKESNFPLEISLIDSSDQMVNHFHEALVGKFGKEVVKIHGGKDILPITLPALTSAVASRKLNGHGFLHITGLLYLPLVLSK